MIQFILGLIIGSVATFFFELKLYSEGTRVNRWFDDDRKSFFGYHIHHSLIGLIILLFGLVYLAFDLRHALFTIGLGLGIIAIHTNSEKRLVFIEKEKKQKHRGS